MSGAPPRPSFEANGERHATWLASLAVAEEVRPVVWGVAMLVLMMTPVWATHALSQEHFSDQVALNRSVSHIPERYGLFTLIVLGEAVVGTVAGLKTGASVPAALVAACGFLIAAALWWLYFARERPVLGRDRLLGSFVWGYGHLLVFAGIAAAGVGIEFAVERAAAGEPLTAVDRATLAAGLGCYLLPLAAIAATSHLPAWIVGLRGGTAIVLLALAGLGRRGAADLRGARRPRRGGVGGAVRAFGDFERGNPLTWLYLGGLLAAGFGGLALYRSLNMAHVGGTAGGRS